MGTDSLTFQSLAVTICTTGFDIKKFYILAAVCLYVLCGSQNKQHILPYTALSNWFL